MSLPGHPDCDHFYKGRWWTKRSYDVMREYEVKAFGKPRDLAPGEGPPEKIAADRKAGLIQEDVLKEQFDADKHEVYLTPKHR